MKLEKTFDGYKLIPTSKNDQKILLTLANELDQNSFMTDLHNAKALPKHKLKKLVHSGKPYPDGVPDWQPSIVLTARHTWVIYVGDGER